MRLTIGRKLGLGIGTLLSLFLVVGLVAYTQTRFIDETIREITEIEEPTSAAAYEMEINLIGTGFGVLGYLQDRDPAHRERVADDERDFERFMAQYDDLVETEQGKQLGAKVKAKYQTFKSRGDDLMRIKDDSAKKEKMLDAYLDEMDDLLDEHVQVLAGEAAETGLQRLIAISGMERVEC